MLVLIVGGLSFSRPPHLHTRLTEPLQKNLSPQNFLPQLRTCQLPVEGKGWLLLKGGRQYPLGHTQVPFSDWLPPACWQGQRRVLVLDNQDFFVFQPLHSDGQIWAVAVFLYTAKPVGHPALLVVIGLTLSGLGGLAFFYRRDAEQKRRRQVAEVTHNLGTPMTAMLLWLDSLRQKSREPQQRDTLEKLIRESQHVALSLRRLVDLNGPLPMQLETISLREPLWEVLENLEGTGQVVKLTLRVETDPETQVLADRERLRELFQILLGNVVHHAGLQATCQIWAKLDRDRVRVRIQNTLGHLPSETNSRGSGLGLAVARRICQGHGSQLRFHMPPNREVNSLVWAEFELSKAPAFD